MMLRRAVYMSFMHVFDCTCNSQTCCHNYHEYESRNCTLRLFFVRDVCLIFCNFCTGPCIAVPGNFEG